MYTCRLKVLYSLPPTPQMVQGCLTLGLPEVVLIQRSTSYNQR